MPNRSLSSYEEELQVSRDIDLVYGGGSLGLMGLVSHAVHRGGRHVVGVVPRALMTTPQIIGETVGEVKIVEDMHQRKAEMARQSDAFIALPGGYGTLEELFQVIRWAQLGIHHKPVGLLNVDGYYNSLLTFNDKAVEEGFINPSARHIVVQATSVHELMEKLEGYIPYDGKAAPSDLNWEPRMIADDAGDGSQISSPSYDTYQILQPCKKLHLSPMKESTLMMDKNCSGIGEVGTPQLVPTKEMDEEVMIDAPWEKLHLSPMKESTLMMDKNCSGIGEVGTPQLVPTKEMDEEVMIDASWEKPHLSPMKEAPLMMDKNCSGIGEVGTHQLVPIKEMDEEIMIYVPWEKLHLSPMKEAPLMMDKNCSGIGEVGTSQLVPTKEMDEEVMIDASRP